MPELRKDPVTRTWVIISSDRARRPSDFMREPAKLRGGFCVFCPGNEDRCPPTILSYGSSFSANNGNSASWSVRVIPNKYPALGIEGTLERQGEGLFDRMTGIGAHEVVVESPAHQETLANMPVERVEQVLRAFRERMNDLKKDARFQYIQVFKNHGEAAGATLEHSHSQLIALPMVPKAMQEELEGARQYFDWKQRCIFCDIVRQELESGTRIVAEHGEIVTLAPFASRFPFETWILPRRHEPTFEAASDALLASTAKALKSVMARMDRVLDSPAYNLALHTSPIVREAPEHYHWHFEIMPKLARVAGFEFGAGYYINPTPPEEAARFLREARAEQRQPVAR